jgi:hypothetical protein
LSRVYFILFYFFLLFTNRLEAQKMAEKKSTTEENQKQEQEKIITRTWHCLDDYKRVRERIMAYGTVLFSLQEFADLIGKSYGWALRACRADAVFVVMIGKSPMIPYYELERICREGVHFNDYEFQIELTKRLQDAGFEKGGRGKPIKNNLDMSGVGHEKSPTPHEVATKQELAAAKRENELLKKKVKKLKKAGKKNG